MTTEIVLFPKNGEWLVEMVGDEQTFELFGITVLPTPFTTAVDVNDVITEIQGHNPGCSVDFFASYDEWLAEVLDGTPYFRPHGWCEMTTTTPCLGCGHSQRHHIGGEGLCLVQSCRLCKASPMTRAEALAIPHAEPLMNGRCVGHVELDVRYGTVLVMDWHDPAGCEHVGD